MDGKLSSYSDDVCSGGDIDAKSICRDFLRNVCHRGRRCKFKHPSPEELRETVDVSTNGIAYEFCHDFQNNQCQRSNCRFIHCSKEEEDNYVITKTLPLRLKYQYDFGIGDYFLGHNKSSSENKHLPAETSGRPVCRDYLNGDCRRGKKCKFAHVDQEQIALLTVEAEKGLGLKQESGVKRPRMLVEENLTISSDYCNLRSNPTAVTCIPTSKYLEEENQNLRKRVEELEKQVSDLAATNEVLLEQNAQFRLQKRGISTYVRSSEGANSFAANPTAVVVSNAPVPVQLNMQVSGQPQELAEFISPPGPEILAAGPAPPRAVVAQNPLHQGSVSVTPTTDMAQVIAAKIAVNTGGKVEVIPATNQVVSALSGPIPQGNPQLGQAQVSPLPPQPLSTFSVSGQTPHNQIVQPPMASFATAMQGHNQIPAAQQPVSFAGTIMAAAIGGGRCAIQTATVPGEILQSSVGSMGPAVPLPQPALVYTVTRTTDNMPLASTIVPATGHEVTLMADRSCNPVSSMPGPMLVPPRGAQQGFNNTASQAMVQPQSHQNNEIPPLQCGSMTSGIGGGNKQMSPAVSRGAVHPVVPNNHVQSPRVKGAQRGVVQGASSLSDPNIITYPLNAVAQTQLHN